MLGVALAKTGPRSSNTSTCMSSHSQLLATRFYGILDTGYVSESQWTAKFEALISGGAKTIQLRAKKQTHAQREALLQPLLEIYHKLATDDRPALIVNDDLDLVLKHPEVGLHIGQDDTPPVEARNALGHNRILGLSTHSPKQIDDALALPEGILSYFAVGPVFPTQTKPDYIPVGLELVRYAASKNPLLPFFCIGGINRQNTRQVAQAGGQRVVTVSDALLAKDTARAVKETIDQL